MTWLSSPILLKPLCWWFQHVRRFSTTERWKHFAGNHFVFSKSVRRFSTTERWKHFAGNHFVFSKSVRRFSHRKMETLCWKPLRVFQKRQAILPQKDGNTLLETTSCFPKASGDSQPQKDGNTLLETTSCFPKASGDSPTERWKHFAGNHFVLSKSVRRFSTTERWKHFAGNHFVFSKSVFQTRRVVSSKVFPSF